MYLITPYGIIPITSIHDPPEEKKSTFTGGLDADEESDDWTW